MVQIENGYATLRLKFYKVGKLQYISHLDLVRTFNKILVRAHLPLWYTEGFNPKPKLSFVANLSIGTESVCEYMDIRLTEVMDPEAVRKVLNANLTDEMQITEAYYPDSKLTAMTWLRYEIRIHTDGTDAALADRCREVLNADRIEVMKRNKEGQSVPADIRASVRSAEVSVENGDLRIDAVLGFLNPEYLIDALRAGAGILHNPDLTKEYYSVMRTAAYFEDMTPFR